MKNFYMAVSAVVESTFTDEPGGNYAYMVKFTSSDNLKSVTHATKPIEAR